MLRDKVYAYYIEQGMNCAEAMLLGANDEYELGLSPESANLIGGFGDLYAFLLGMTGVASFILFLSIVSSMKAVNLG